jgi:(p)ppGpp synthase/HD superfamily hydrolase
MPTLERAIVIAAEAHAGTVDKAGAPYIMHPLRLMMKMESTTGMIVAVLHDVVEDNVQWTLPRLEKEGFSHEIIEAVDALTRRKGELYPHYIERAAKNGLAREVKIRDLEDNINIRRIHNPTDEDRRRIIKYESALNKLKAM